MSKYTVKYDAGEIQDNLDGVIDKPALTLSNTSTNSKGEVTTSSVQFTFSEPTVDGESATLIKNNLKLANLNRGAIVLDQDTTESSIDIEDELESSTNYQATLTQYADEQIEAYSEVKFKTAQDAPFDISTDTITLRQGDSTEISFTNDGCSLSVNSEYSLVNITQNTNSIGLTAVTNDMGSDHLTITATKDGFFTKTFSITVIVPDVTIECSPLAISIDGDVDEYKDVVVTTNGDSISYSINNDNCSVELLSTSQDGLTKTYRVYGESDGGSVITFNALVDGNVVETCTCGVTLSNMFTPQIAFTASKNGTNINFFSNSNGFNTSDYDVYINRNKTSQAFNSLTFNANDKIQIKANKEVTYFPYLYADPLEWNETLKRWIPTLDYIQSIDYAFPLMSMDNSTEVTDFNGCFEECSSLTSIPQDLFKYNPNVTGFRSCFSGCTSLTSIPQDLFKYNTKVIFFEYCFSGCSNVTSAVPELWITYPNSMHCTGCFSGCINASNYADIPSEWPSEWK